jgi:hypothetical protein
MITDIDPYFSTRSAFDTQTATRTAPNRRLAPYGHLSAFSQSLAERESAFERIHGSLWQRGLLDRLTTPLTRYHE